MANALLARPVVALPPPGRALAGVNAFAGAGIYAIYYTGERQPYAAYERIAVANRGERFEQPISVGKAIPKGARNAGIGLDIEPGPELFGRLREHATSIDQATNLDLEGFRCRYLVVDDIWIPLGESLAIHRFRPVWNPLIDGFGNHDPGSGRSNQQLSRWDTIHPGRPWAPKLGQPNALSREQIDAVILAFVMGQPVPVLSVLEALGAEESGANEE